MKITKIKLFFLFLIPGLVFLISDVQAASYVIKEGVVADSAGGNNQRKLARTANGDLHVVYHRSDGTYQQIYYAKSIDNGATWSETQLTDEAYAQNRPSIVTDSGDNLHVVWWGKYADSTTINQIRYRKYTNGVGWGDTVNLTTGLNEQNQSSVVVDSDDNLHLVWSGKTDNSPTIYQIRYLKYTNGVDWGEITDLTDENYDQNRPFLSTDSSNYVHVMWWGRYADSTSYDQVRYVKYTDGWQSIENLTSGNYHQNYPSFAIDSNDYIHAAWRGLHPTAADTYQIRYVKYTDSWGEIENLTSEDSTRHQWNPFVAVDSNDYVYVAWNGRHASSTATYEIRHVKYTEGWGEVENLTTSVVNQQHPNLIWFLNPTINNAKTNRPKDGYAFVWASSTVLQFYSSDDLSWDTPTYNVGGNVSGLSGTLVLQNLGGDNLSLASDGAFSFGTALDSGSVYTVTILTQPDGQTCSIANGSGEVVSTSITNIAVSCADDVEVNSNSSVGGGSGYDMAFIAANQPVQTRPITITELQILISQLAQQLKLLQSAMSDTAAISSRSSFNLPLRFGQNHSQVKILQQILNKNPATQVSVQGAGSPGYETAYFGPATLQAIKKFQLYYQIVSSSDELGYGFVGPKTRGKLNELLQAGN